MGAFDRLPTLAEMSSRPRACPKGSTRLEVKAAADKTVTTTAKAFRAAVWARDGGTCRKCGVKVQRTLELTPKRGEVHHIAKRSRWKALLTDPRNGLLLCARCHEAIEHKRLFIVTSGKDCMFELDGRSFIDAGHPGVRFVAERPAVKGGTV